MKKKLTLLAILFIAILALVACGGGGSDNGDNGGGNAIKLAQPVLTLQGKTLSWNAVQNANGYLVQINENAPIENQGTTYSLVSLVANGTYTLKVKAVGNGENYTDSDWSLTKDYVVSSSFYTVSFNTDGGSTVAPKTNITSGSKIEKPIIDPTLANYRFGGWYKEANCTNEWNFATDVVDSETTLYAHWLGTEGLFYNTYGYVSKGTANTNGIVSIQKYYEGVDITKISAGAFEDCATLTGIVIPNTVSIIGNSAFEDCVALADIIIPNSVTSIEDSAFRGCSLLVSINLPVSVTTIG